MAGTRILSFLAALVALLGSGAPPAMADTANGIQFTLANTLPKEMVIEFTFENDILSRQVTNRYTVPPRQTIQAAEYCGTGLCPHAELNVLGVGGYIVCNAHLQLYGAVTVTLIEVEVNQHNALFSCDIAGPAVHRTLPNTGVYDMVGQPPR